MSLNSHSHSLHVCVLRGQGERRGGIIIYVPAKLFILLLGSIEVLFTRTHVRIHQYEVYVQCICISVYNVLCYLHVHMDTRVQGCLQHFSIFSAISKMLFGSIAASYQTKYVTYNKNLTWQERGERGGPLDFIPGGWNAILADALDGDPKMDGQYYAYGKKNTGLTLDTYFSRVK